MFTAIRWIFPAISVFALIGCPSSSDDPPPADVFLTDVFSESQIAGIEALGIQMNLGDNPPNIEGTFFVDPIVLQATTIVDNQVPIGNVFEPLVVTFSNQNNASRTLDLVAGADTSVVVTSTDSFISGSGNAFTAIFLTQSVQSDGSSFMATDAYSGIVSEAGIENFERAIVFANDQDTGNISIDLDGFSERVEDPPEGFDGSLAAVENLFSDTQLEAVQALGVQFNLGNNPPVVDGNFLLDTVTLQATSVPGTEGSIGAIGEFGDPNVVSFSNQDNANLTIDFSSNSTEPVDNIPVVANGAAISGSGNDFSVYFIGELTTPGGTTFLGADIYNGTVAELGIENFQRTVLVFDDQGDPADEIIPNNSGFLVIDNDGLAEEISDAEVMELLSADLSDAFDGSPVALADIYTQTEIDTLEALGLTLNFGDNPPDVTGVFRLDPGVLVASTIDDDGFGIGNALPATLVGFSNINPTAMELNLSVTDEAGIDIVTITNAFISGSGNAFSVYSIGEVTLADGSILNTRETFSGNLTDSGIESFQWALLPLDQATGEIDLGRLFIDMDGLSENVGAVALVSSDLSARNEFFSRLVQP